MHWLDIILLVLLVISLIRGFSSGFIKQAINLASVIGAFFLATPFSLFVVDLIAKHGPTITNSWISWIISFLLLIIIIRLIANFLLSGIEVVLGTINRILGAALSLLITMVFLSVLLGFYSNVGKKYNWTPIPNNLVIYPVIQEIGKTILPEHLFIQDKSNDSFEEQMI